MALFNYATKEITLKIVYYGPGLSGKTTNIEYLHSTFDPKRRGKLLSLSTEADRTLFFDFLPVEIGKIKNFSIRFQLYTVPGQVRYNSTRKLVLKGADAIVFVADSQKEMRDANIESFENMKENLIDNDLDIEDLPIVFQFNKRDLTNVLSVDELNSDLNTRNSTCFESAAIEGKGVQEVFQAITKQLLKHIAKKHRIDIETKDLKPGTGTAEAPAVSPVTEPSPVEEVPVLEALDAGITEDVDIEEAVESEPVQTSIEEEALDKVPSLEDLQKQLSRDLDDQETPEEESIISASQEIGEIGDIPSLEEIQEEAKEDSLEAEDSSATGREPFDEKLDITDTAFGETPSEPMEELPGHEDDATVGEIEPETPSEDDFTVSEIEEKGEDEEIKDESIESIYKAFMSDEGTPPPAVTPQEEPAPAFSESPLPREEIPEPDVYPVESSGKPSPSIEDHETEAMKAFGDAVTPSFEPTGKPHKGTAAPEEMPFVPASEPPAAMSEGTRNVILDEINSLSKVINKVNSSISSFKSEMNVLSDKILDMDKRLSEMRAQTSEMQELINDGSGSATTLTTETLQTIMELKRTIDNAKKSKFWLFFS